MSRHNLLSNKTCDSPFVQCVRIGADDPKLHVLFIPGNPGIIAFYKDFLESLYEQLGGVASITAIGHISQTKRDWEHGRLFSMQDQIDHKISETEPFSEGAVLFSFWLVDNGLFPVGHSIGSYLSIEVLRKFQEKVIYCIAPYPFLRLNPKSKWQPIVGMISVSSILSTLVSFIMALLGLQPKWALTLPLLKSIGRSWSTTAVEAACGQLLKYHSMRNVLFMAMTEFLELSETPDWTFLRGNRDKITFLFGDDDHWGPLQMFEEISKQVPEIALSIEREGHTHTFLLH